MKRGVLDVLRRGLDNMLTNWPLLAIRVGETFVFAIMVVLSAIAVIVPILVSIGLHMRDLVEPDGMESALMTLADQWPVLIWITLAAFVVVGIMVAVHSFVEAGCARVYVDAERAAGPAAEGPRSRFHVFSAQRWMAGAKDGWWAVFWIYNYAWGVAGLILLVPLLVTLVLMYVFRENGALLAGSGCIGLAVTALVGLPVCIVTAIWTNRSIADWAAHRAAASTSLSLAWAAVKRDFARHLLIALALFVVSLAGSSVLSTFSFFASFSETISRHSSSIAFFTIPLRTLGTVLNMIFSAAVAGWYLAAYSALATET